MSKKSHYILILYNYIKSSLKVVRYLLLNFCRRKKVDESHIFISKNRDIRLYKNKYLKYKKKSVSNW